MNERALLSTLVKPATGPVAIAQAMPMTTIARIPVPGTGRLLGPLVNVHQDCSIIYPQIQCANHVTRRVQYAQESFTPNVQPAEPAVQFNLL